MTTEGTEHMDPPLRFDRRLPNHPALHATWRGNFRVIGDTPGKFDGIRAHPASKVHINAYEFSKRMPEVLQFEFHPRGNFWEDVFEGDIPDGLDIGLYFFPRADRAREIYALLVEHIQMHDYVLRCSMGEVELWITTSKHLHRDSQRINNEHFLWGFFQESTTVEDPLKVTKNLDNSAVVDMDTDMSGGENIVRNSCISFSDCGQPMLNGHQSSDLASGKAEDMEVDMLAGQSVGKVDVVVPMPSEQKNMTIQPVSQVKPKPVEGNQLFHPRVISAGLLRKPVEKVNAHAPLPSKQENHSHQLLSKVKTECIEEGMLPRTSNSAAATNLASTDVLCKTISGSPFGYIEQAPPGFTQADKVKNKERMKIPPVPSYLTPTAMYAPTSSSSLVCVGSAPPGFTGTDKVKNKDRMSIPPVPSTLTPTAMLCKSTSSSPLACVGSAPPGFTEADKVKNKDRTNSPVVLSNLTPTARLFTATHSSPSACIESAPLGFILADRVKNKDRSSNATASPQKKAISPVIKSESLF
ncbi:PHD finger-containing protein [Drosera capensis]